MIPESIKRIVLPKKENKSNSKRAVIYTRVSTKEQADNNASLETQLKYCREYCQKLDFLNVKEFGGTYESAQFDDERKEFMSMLNFARQKKNDIQFIVVYSLCRFSRTGGPAISIVADLFLKNEIQVRSVTQATDVSTPEGQLQTNILMLFSKYDNDVRRQKVMSGMREKLLQGYFVFNAPIGYSASSTRGLPIQNEKAPFIKRAFEMKLMGYTHDVILELLMAKGFKIGIKRLTDIFKNPFYCGYISSKLLNGEVAKGKHEPLISIEVFEKVNYAQIKYNKTDYKKVDIDPFPLKGFILCKKCNRKWTGYQVKKKHKDYYKCNTVGCRCNRSANQLHREFLELLREYKIPDVLEGPLKAQLGLVFNERNKEKIKEQQELKLNLNRLEERIEMVTTRFGIADITKDVYDTTMRKLNSEKFAINKRIDETKIQLSNHKEFIEFSVNLSRNLDQAWDLGNSVVRRRLQYVVFPDGIEYDNVNRSYRTIKVNGIFSLFNSMSSGYKRKEEGLSCNPSSYSGLVVPTGIEPVSKV